jgi:hypothetical protein
MPICIILEGLRDASSFLLSAVDGASMIAGFKDEESVLASS